MSKRKKNIIYETLNFLFAIIIVLILRSSIFTISIVPSASMENTLMTGDITFVNRLAYGYRNPLNRTYIKTWNKPEYNDIVVFDYPLDQSIFYVKRLIGKPGDKIKIENGILYRNDKNIGEEYILNKVDNSKGDTFQEVIVPENSYFVMGDNRDFSLDSRFWGFLPSYMVVGKVEKILMSVDKETWIPKKNRFFKDPYKY